MKINGVAIDDTFAEAFGMTRDAARRHRRHRGWARQRGRDA